jgi:thiol-disulfide isomerase/thioredoxin
VLPGGPIICCTGSLPAPDPQQYSSMMSLHILLLILLLCLPACLMAGELQRYESLLQAPALSLPDLGGKTRNLTDYRGQVLLVNFWASWCPPCIQEMPAMQRLQDRLAGKAFSILAVNVGESAGTVWKFLGKVKVDFTLLRDSDGQTAREWEVTTYPTSFLIDRTGTVRYLAHGAVKWDAPEMVRIIEEMLDGHSTQQGIHSRLPH